MTDYSEDRLMSEAAQLRAALERLAVPIDEPKTKWKPAVAAYWKREALKRCAQAGRR